MSEGSPGKNVWMDYELKLAATAGGVGFFSCVPARAMAFEEALEVLRAHPMDDFMHRSLLDEIGGWEPARMERMIARAVSNDPLLQTLLYEATLLHDSMSGYRDALRPTDPEQCLEFTPLILIRSSLLEDQPLHSRWMEVLSSNIEEHRELPASEALGLEPPFSEEELSASRRDRVLLREIVAELGSGGESGIEGKPLPPPVEVFRQAMEKLKGIGIVAGPEMRHVASLSPYAYLRRWHLRLSVENGRHHYTVSGTQTSYGRGLALADARASYAMEMVERASAFAGFDARGVRGTNRNYPLIHGSYESLCADPDLRAIDPNRFRLEVPYRNEPLYWLQGERFEGGTLRPIWIPAQCVFLFCNLDEISLFSGLGSTGLASGTTMEQAKVSALLEAIERDAEGVTPYDPAACFRVEAQDSRVSSLLADYEAKGIQVQFQELSSIFGVPCYKCFVVGPEGQIVKGTGAHLDGKRALISALTETPYPYPYGPASGAGPQGLPTIGFEDLPNAATGRPELDLKILERLIEANGFQILYVDLTREDLQIPVVRAFVPGLELITDFDRFSRVSPRLYRNALSLSREA